MQADEVEIPYGHWSSHKLRDHLPFSLTEGSFPADTVYTMFVRDAVTCYRAYANDTLLYVGFEKE